MPTSNSPKPTAESNPKKISTSVMDLLTEHKDAIPRIVARQTARITAMSTEKATHGRQLAPRTRKRKTAAKPIPLPTHPKPTPKRKSRAERSRYMMDPPDNDPEDDPDNEYGLQSKKRRSDRTKRYTNSDSDSSDSSEADFLMNDLVDDSDEEERGDQSRRSPDDRDSGYSRETLRAFYDGDDSTP